MSDNFRKVNKNNVVSINKKKVNNVKITPKKLFILAIAFILLFALLLGRVAWIQFVDGDWLREKEYSQSTSSTLISAKRGTIYDSNRKSASSQCRSRYNISKPRSYIKAKGKDGQTDEEATEELKRNMANAYGGDI